MMAAREIDLGQFAAPTKNKPPKPHQNHSQPKPRNALHTTYSSLVNAQCAPQRGHKLLVYCCNRNRSVARKPYANGSKIVMAGLRRRERIGQGRGDRGAAKECGSESLAMSGNHRASLSFRHGLPDPVATTEDSLPSLLGLPRTVPSRQANAVPATVPPTATTVPDGNVRLPRAFPESELHYIFHIQGRFTLLHKESRPFWSQILVAHWLNFWNQPQGLYTRSRDRK